MIITAVLEAVCEVNMSPYTIQQPVYTIQCSTAAVAWSADSTLTYTDTQIYIGCIQAQLFQPNLDKAPGRESGYKEAAFIQSTISQDTGGNGQ